MMKKPETAILGISFAVRPLRFQYSCALGVLTLKMCASPLLDYLKNFSHQDHYK